LTGHGPWHLELHSTSKCNGRPAERATLKQARHNLALDFLRVVRLIKSFQEMCGNLLSSGLDRLPAPDAPSKGILLYAGFHVHRYISCKQGEYFASMLTCSSGFHVVYLMSCRLVLLCSCAKGILPSFVRGCSSTSVLVSMLAFLGC
jgi:hypothetical protein